MLHAFWTDVLVYFYSKLIQKRQIYSTLQSMQINDTPKCVMCVPSCDENIMPMLALVLRAHVDMFENSSLRLSLYVFVAGKYHIQP